MSPQKGSSKSDKEVPKPEPYALKFYPAVDERRPKKARKNIRPTKYRSSLKPGTVLILLAGRFRGKRVVLLKTLSQGVLLVTGPFKTSIDVKGIDQAVLDKIGGDKYFTSEKKEQKKGEEAFFKQGEKPDPKKIDSGRADDQKAIDKVLLSNLKKGDATLRSYLGSSFSLRKGDRPHEMVF